MMRQLRTALNHGKVLVMGIVMIKTAILTFATLMMGRKNRKGKNPLIKQYNPGSQVQTHMRSYLHTITNDRMASLHLSSMLGALMISVSLDKRW